MNEEKIKFLNEFKDWTKEELLSRAFEICVRCVELTRERNKLSNTLEEIRKYVENTRVDNNYMVQEKYEHILQMIDNSIKKED